jgi:recombination protein RecT
METKDKEQIKEKTTVEEFINRDKFKEELTKLTGDPKKTERFIRLGVSQLRDQPKLMNCYPPSFASALLSCAEINLEPSKQKQLVYFIPSYNKDLKRDECQFMVSYKGMCILAYRTGVVKDVYAEVIYDGDHIKAVFGTNAYFEHIPILNAEERGEVMAYYAYCKLVNNIERKKILLPKDIDRIKQSSKNWQSSYSPWNTHYDAQAKKTCIKQLFSTPFPEAQFVKSDTVELGNLGIITDSEDYEHNFEVEDQEETGEVKTKAEDLTERLG